MSRSESQIRRELDQLMGEQAALEPDDIAGKARLMTRRDALTAELRAMAGPGAREAQQEWAERAASKPSREGKPYISSPGEGGV